MSDGLLIQLEQFFRNSKIAVQGVTDTLGTTTTVVDATARSEAVDFWNDNFSIVLLSGNNAGEIRQITDFDGAGTLTVGRAFTNAVASGVTYLIRRDDYSLQGANSADNLTETDLVVANEDGSIVERLEQIQEAVNVGTGTNLPSNASLVDALGTDSATVTDSATTVLGAIGANNANNAFDSSNVVANVDGSTLERLEFLQSVSVVGSGTFTTDSATVPADTSQGAKADNWFNGCILLPTTGAVAYQPRLIVDFTTTTGVFTLDSEHPFTGVPGLSDYIILSNEANLVPAADSTANTTADHVIGNKSDTIPAMNLAPSATDSLVRHTKAILERVGATPNDPDDSLHTVVGQRDDSATNDDMSDIATTSMAAKLYLILNRLSTDAFTATIQGSARVELDTMLAQLATYISASGAAMSTQTFNQTARTNIEQVLEDFALALGIDGANVWTQINGLTAPTNLDDYLQDMASLWGADGANVFNPTIDGAPRTTLESALEALAGLSDENRGLVFQGTVSNATDVSNFKIAELGGFGDDFFNTNFFAYCIHNADASGTAPEGEIQDITDYTSSDGSFVTGAFTIAPTVGDEFYVMHESLATLVPTFDSSGIANDFDGSIIEILKAGLEKDTAGAYDADTDSNEAISEAIVDVKTDTQYLINSSLSKYGTVTTVPDTTHFTCNDLIGFGDGIFAGVQGFYFVFVQRDNGGTGAAPQGEYRAISNYVSATGTFTHAAFGTSIVPGDEVLIVHSSIILGDGALAYGTFTTDSATAPADTGKGALAQHYYRGCMLMPISGACAFQPRMIRSFTTGTGVFTLDTGTPFTSAPGLVDYVILPSTEVYVPSADSVSNILPAHVIGNKTDAAVTAPTTTKSLIAYTKGALDLIGSPVVDVSTDIAAVQADVGDPSARTNFQNLEDMIGIPDAANSNLDDILRTGYDSTAITANADGSVLERLEDLKAKSDGTPTASSTNCTNATETTLVELNTGTVEEIDYVNIDLSDWLADSYIDYPGEWMKIRKYMKVDGTNYVQVDVGLNIQEIQFYSFTNISEGVTIPIGSYEEDVKFTFESSTAPLGSVAIYYHLVKYDKEA